MAFVERDLQGARLRELDEGSFVWCDKRMQKADGKVSVDMNTYVKNLSPVQLSPEMRSDPDAALSGYELRQFRAICGCLQWLAAQMRCDFAFQVSTLQAERGGAGPIVASLI